MDAANTLVRLGQRLKPIRSDSRQEEGKKLLAWVTAGGLLSLKAGLVSFLTAATTQPAGSTFYDEQVSIPHDELVEDPSIVLLRQQYANTADIEANLKERKDIPEGVDITNMAAYMAGYGLSLASVREATHEYMKVWYQRYSKNVTTADDYITAFLKGRGDPSMIQRAMHRGPIADLLDT